MGNCNLGPEDIPPTFLHADIHTQVLAHGRLWPHVDYYTILHRHSPLRIP